MFMSWFMYSFRLLLQIIYVAMLCYYVTGSISNNRKKMRLRSDLASNA